MTDSEKLDLLIEKVANLESNVQDLGSNVQSLESNMQSLESNMQKVNDRLDVLEIKQDRTAKKLDELQLDVKIAERDIRRDIHRLNDQMETVIEVLKQHELLPG